ncbi:serine/threonine-protein kinase 36 [Salarias fasciatus]|nr:serine/threonine-protein kinase 36 [Salarias fasciatus]
MNRYHVLQLVGEGSFGRVHKGREKYTGQVVALKFMPKVNRSEKELQSLKREIEIMRGLQHPNIVQLFDSFETETEVVVVTEYAEGQLFQILEDDGSFPEFRVREIACQLVSALYYLHSHRILHRDMKPQNILLGKTGTVKLCDFGFARAMSVSTLVLTSIKGTPLYMSPELVEEKPYDHTADLWSLGCILYELHTGAPPFYTNSIFHLIQLIVRDQVKWPDSMSDTCTSFLKGLLTKDPLKRLSWPALLHHPFVADGVTVLSDTSVFSPLTVSPSPDMLARKLKQVAEKSVATSGPSRLLRKVTEQRDCGNRRKPVGSNTAKKNKDLSGHDGANPGTAPSNVSNPKPPSNDVSVAPGHTASETSSSPIPVCTASDHRGQISIDYEKEFCNVEIGPQLVERRSEDGLPALHRQDVDDEENWVNLAPASDTSRKQKEHLDHTAIISQLESKILEFKAQLAAGCVKDVQIHRALKVLHNLMKSPDLEMTEHVVLKLGLPHVLFDLIHTAVESSEFFKQPWFVPVLGEMMTVLMIYWETHRDWVEDEHRLGDLSKPFGLILTDPELRPLAPLAATVLSLFTQFDVDVQTNVENLTSLLNALITDSCQLHISPPAGWGLCDGLLSLLLFTLTEHENGSVSSCLNPALLLDLWKRIGTSAATTTLHFCSVDGLYSFLSIVLHICTKDPSSCIPLLTDYESKCVHTLGWLLGTDCLNLFAESVPWRADVDLSHDNLSALSCHLLCFPFTLDLPPHTMSTVLQLYDSCGIVTHLLQVIRTFPPSQLELPLALLCRLLLCDPERSLSRLRESAFGFFSPPSDSQPAASARQPPTRTASSLLSELLQLDVLWDSAQELLNVLSHVARCSSPSACFQLHVEASVLRRALSHSYDLIRAAACRLLGNLDPFRPPSSYNRQLDIFKDIIRCLHDAHTPVRRTACRAVGNWLGYVAVECSEHTGKEQIAVTNSLTAKTRPRVDVEERRRWANVAGRTVPVLTRLTTDSDVLTRRHCCEALGNLADVEGAACLLLEHGVSGSLLRAACSDPDRAVKKAATATLCLYAQHDSLRQALLSLDARKKLLQASLNSPSQCDYQQLIRQL